ncbi:carbon monoxide dehydrogenase, coxC signalling protein [Bradyrhizobium sp. ORS 285]|uniref:MHYT domain-containing protein n=1 Tax=Bradyrhizobium sp. ORS 285 TaxID=115808 RepID=UPI0002406DFF|nr:MHYT domain-containing protein [Bradyrhizobium sp. ORS 285]CCD89571.1 carbon monoxide dehydrogenase, coxC signalling protein [Bradyrhizobium sp. ORS 285]SMX60769.1 carbon monoxide dehydrogenase, coxC signalling protein [Bradyrhizobium sp. ORS 285]
MIEGYDPYLVALSVVIASLGGYTGFSLTARIRSGPGANPRVLLSGAAAILAVGIWTMHFVGMMAAPMPTDAVYLVLPTIISFLICALVVGISLFFVSIGDPSAKRVIPSALLLGAGIASMHYVGMHGLAGSFGLTHDPALVALSVAIAIVAAYGGLRIFLARQDGLRLAISALAFGIAVSGMHYTAMLGMHVVPAGEGHHHQAAGLAASPQALAIVVAVLCFVVAAGFLLSLVPEPHRASQPATVLAEPAPELAPEPAMPPPAQSAAPSPAEPVETIASTRITAAPLGGIGQPPRIAAVRLPLEGANGTHFIDAGDVRSVRADAHYTRVHDGTRERMCPWSISEAEAQLDPGRFIRVHRSHIVAIEHVTFVGKEGEGAIIELDGPSKPRVPVSRAKVAEVKARLGLRRPA